MSFSACARCSCLVKLVDSRCPFCGAARRTVRTEWMVLASVVVLGGCNAGTAECAAAEAGPDGRADACVVTSGDPFSCGNQTCERWSQYCADDRGTYKCITGKCSGGSAPWDPLSVSCGDCTGDDAGASFTTCSAACYGAPPSRAAGAARRTGGPRSAA